jgi:enoyl-CoA hydratase/carnithine racemase
MTGYEQIRYEVTDPVGLITLDRPEAMNAWTDQMAGDVRAAVEAAEADPAVVAIVVTGAGRGFCAGADMKLLSSIAGGDGDGPGRAEAARLAGASADQPAAPTGGSAGGDFDGAFTYLLATTKPIIAAINGPVAGMAVPFVLCCDLRFMSADAVVLTAFAQRGLIAEWGLSWLLPRLVGPAVALDLLFSSRKVGGEEAARIGLVNACLPADELLPHCMEYVQHLAQACSPASLAIMKRQVYEQLHVGLGRAERDSQRLMVESFGRPDFAEGVSSFLEKRPPAFGRLPREG